MSGIQSPMQWDMLTQQEPSDADSDAVGRNLRVNQSRFAAHSAAQPGEGSQQASGISPNVSTARTDDELGSKLHRDQGKLVWAMFGSSWCHHCHELFPSVYEISKKFPKNDFVVAQMDYMDAAVQGIRYTPTFRLYRKGRRLDEFIGTDAQRVEDHVWLWSDSDAQH
ncbi:hypothetical protein ABBQ38_006837 [Trebouxia sp. C0009 RCD-2024]